MCGRWFGRAGAGDKDLIHAGKMENFGFWLSRTFATTKAKQKSWPYVPGTYFVPTGACLANWLSRAGFADVEIFYSHPMSSEEQRQTEWMVFESYEDFIDKSDSALTVEGYPAPIRIFAKAKNVS